MAKFEVHIPAAQSGGFNMTLRVDADNWMAALKTGMTKLGEQGASVQNVLVDIQDDNSIHVTEAQSGRVFRIRELTEAEAAAVQVKKPTSPELPAAPAPAAAATKAPAPDESAKKTGASWMKAEPAATATPAPSPFGAAPAAAVPADQAPTLPGAPDPEPAEPAGKKGKKAKTGKNVAQAKAEPAKPEPEKPAPVPAPAARPATKSSARVPALEAKQVVEIEQPTQPVVGAIGRKPPTADEARRIEDMLSEVFERVQDIHDQSTEEAAMYFLLDLALEKIPAESGSVYRADAGMGELSFAAVRGPKAADLLKQKITVPAGTGIVGFCATEGVSVAVSDVEKDPRFFKAISDKLKYSTKSVLCAPMMTHGRTFGCLQLLNRKTDAHFTQYEVGLLAYLSHQAALFLNARV